MAKTYNASKSTVTLLNKYDPSVKEVDGLSILDTISKDEEGLDLVYNTGLDSVASGESLRSDKSPWITSHIASIRLFKSNSYVYLAPGDKLVIKTEKPEESLYYATLESELLEVTSEDEEVVVEEIESV